MDDKTKLEHTIKPLVIGAKGFIGSYFYQYLRSSFPDLMGTHHTSCDDLVYLNLEAPSLDFSVSGYGYALILGGIGNPLTCQKDPEQSFRCNVEGPIKLGKLLLERGVCPIFFSSDYVFDGSQALYTSDSPHSPLNEYGRQKAELEKQAVELDSIVVRLSKVYGVEKGDGTLFDEMISTLKQNESIRAARDQVFAPIYIEDVLKGVIDLMHTHQRGIVNFRGPTFASRLQMAQAVARKLSVDESLIRGIQLKDLDDPFQRPHWVHLVSSISAIPWEAGLDKLVRQYAK